MSRVTIKLPELGGAVKAQMSVFVVAVKRAALETFWLAVTGERSPKGSYKTSHHPGKYRASHRASVGAPAYANLPDQGSYPTLGIDAIQTTLSEVSLGKSVHVTNDATSDNSEVSYAPILELGRHVDSLGRMAGSLQAPRGIYGPAIEEVLLPQLGRIVAQASMEAESSYVQGGGG